LDIAVFPSL